MGFTSPRAREWSAFGPDLLGLGVADPRSDGAVRLRVDDTAWRIAIHPGATDDVAYLGWSVGGPEGLADAADRLHHAGVTVHTGNAGLAEKRDVDELAWFIDPFGFRHELSYGQRVIPGSFVPGRPGVSFVTGAEGLGHSVLIVPDFDAATRFFVELLGFRISDDIDDGILVRFLHCNARHHSLAFTALPGMRGFHHLMLEITDHRQVEAAWQMVQDRGLPVAMALGKHTNDEMYSFYVRTPSGFEIEYGCGGKTVDPDKPWKPGHYDAMSSWGHERPATPLFPGILQPTEGTST
ncbi:VOC family protein [Mycobacteroides abscessus]|uniref:VOC family protein n=1 Tax=Mycobacteroides abscessus TaxID=36809 RepID=UPI000C2654AB|nr:VOC family protein [Mycobacteroides abscessus]